MSAPAARTAHEKRGREHEPWLSWARVVGVVAIVSIHVFDHYVRSWDEVSALEWHAGNLVDSAARMGVPLFVIVSGASLLGRPDGLGPSGLASARESVRRFYRRRAVRLGIPLVVWTVFYLWFARWSTDEPVTAYTFVQGFLWGKPYYHLYFLYVIAGLYLITPFLRGFLANASRRLAWLSALLCLGLAILDKGQHLWMGGGGGFNAFSYFVPWVGYYLLGHCLAREFAARRGVVGTRRCRYAAVGVAAFVGAVLATAAATRLLWPRLGEGTLSWTYDYFFPQTVVATVGMAVAVWALTNHLGTAAATRAATRAASTRAAIRAASPRAATRAAVAGAREGTARRRESGRRLADLTFGVFLLHPIPLELWKIEGPGRVFPGQPWLGLGVHVGLLLGLLLVCAAVTYVLQRIPLLRRLV